MNIFCFATVLSTLLLFSAEATAQIYVPLSPNSDLRCIYLPNGKTLIARENSRGYKKLSFETAIKSTAKNLSKDRKLVKQLNELIKDIQGQSSRGIFPIQLNAKEVKAIGRFYVAGELGADIPLSPADNITKLESVRGTFASNIVFETELIKLIQKCKKKQVPSPGTLETIFVNIKSDPYDAKNDLSGSGLVVVYAKVPAYLVRLAPSLCYDHPRQGTRYMSASSVPCVSRGLFYQDSDPSTCDNLIERDSKGNPEFYLAFMEERNFFFKERAGATTFEQAAKGAEADLRTNPIYGWSDSVNYVYVRNIDDCQQSLF